MPDWMAFNVDDYVSNTLHLTARQHGAYILLICAAWKAKGSLPGNDPALMAIAKLNAKDWRVDGDVLKSFLTRRGDTWVHERVEFEWRDAQAIIDAKSKAGKEGARRRWHGRGDGSAMSEPSQPHRQNDAPKPLPSPCLTTTPSATPSAPAARAQLLTEKWEPTESEVKDLRAELSWINDDLWASRMKQFRDWCDANATRTFNPAATWRGFMRQTRRPFEGGKQWAKAGDVSMMPAAEEWGPRMAGWRQSKFWRPERWGPAPGEPGCRAPKHLIGTGGTA
jgi:uncharacterized protein YdaU (DUF1376 family)